MAWLLHPILHVAHLIEERLRAELAASGLQPRQARILVAISAQGPISQADLARAFDVSAPSMTVMIGRLIRDGLVLALPVAGGKRQLLALSDKGQDLIPIIEQAWSVVDDLIREKLGDGPAEALSIAALKARDALGGRAPHERLDGSV